MQNKNRNNREHTKQQSGKTELFIEHLLPIGKENAITTEELVKLCGCGSTRELQKARNTLKAAEGARKIMNVFEDLM